MAERIEIDAPLVTLSTPDAERLRFQEPPSHKLEWYYSPNREIEILCTTDECEDFETECEIALTDDVISDPRDAAALIRYLKANNNLKAR